VFKEERSVKAALDAGHIVVCGSDAAIRAGPSARKHDVKLQPLPRV
jgi:hypothetical protein